MVWEQEASLIIMLTTTVERGRVIFASLNISVTFVLFSSSSLFFFRVYFLSVSCQVLSLYLFHFFLLNSCVCLSAQNQELKPPCVA